MYQGKEEILHRLSERKRTAQKGETFNSEAATKVGVAHYIVRQYLMTSRNRQISWKKKGVDWEGPWSSCLGKLARTDGERRTHNQSVSFKQGIKREGGIYPILKGEIFSNEASPP